MSQQGVMEVKTESCNEVWSEGKESEIKKPKMEEEEDQVRRISVCV